MKTSSALLIQQDLQHIWHPCSQMKDYENFKPLIIKKAKNSHLYLENGQKIIDAISSWWCKSLGHQHSALKKALYQQLEKFEHVIFANTTYPVIINLSQQLTNLCVNLNKVFYAGDGSCAVETALKMSLQARIIQGESHKTKFLSLENGYHGETIGALSVSDLGLYKKPYEKLCFKTNFISGIPYVSGITDPLWHNCSEHWKKIEVYLNKHAYYTTAIIIEPIIQGAGGMKIYSQDFLKRLSQWTTKNNIHLIADEIMTGLCRSGKMLACEYAGIQPDFLCLSKGLTSGWLPFSAMLTTDKIYALFYDDYQTGKSFLHSHTFSGNALGACIALEVLNVMAAKKLDLRAQKIGYLMLNNLQEIAANTGKLKNIRQIGAIAAADLITNNNTQRRLGFEIYQAAVKFGALLRPLGNTIYWLPPLTISSLTLHKLKTITEKAIQSVKF